MRRSRTSLLRRVVMWTAGVVLVVSVAGWVVSWFQVGWASGPPRGQFVGLGYSQFWMYEDNDRARGWFVDGFFFDHQWFVWAPGPGGIVAVPLWIPTAISLLVLGAGWLAGRRVRRWSRAGRCPSCAYDLTGLTGPCPECGRERGQQR